MFNPALVKPLIGIVVSSSTSRVVGSIIRNNLTATTRLQQVQLAIGAGSLGMIAGSAASKAVIDEIESIESIVQGFKEAKKEQEQS